MEYPLSEILDRLSILRLKSARLPFDPTIKAELQRFEAAVGEVVIVRDWLRRLSHINGQIWDLEASIRQGDELPLTEVGRRAIAIRDLNGHRIRIKNEIARAKGEFEEIKVDHASA